MSFRIGLLLINLISFCVLFCSQNYGFHVQVSFIQFRLDIKTEKYNKRVLVSWNLSTTWVALNHGQDHDQIWVVNMQTSSRTVGFFLERDSDLILETVSALVKSDASTYYVELQNIIMILGHDQ